MTTLDFRQEALQWSYIEKLRAYFAPGSRYHIRTYGCQMNEHDSENLAGLLDEMGLTPAEDASGADLVILNTCCVREHAEIKVQGLLGALRLTKEARPGMVLCVCGCMMQQAGVARETARRFPHVDLIFGTHQVHRFAELLFRALETGNPVVEADDREGMVIEHMPAHRATGVTAWVNIMYGCDNFCSYCVVPYVRGRERSREVSEILQEVRQLADQGVREVTLLGQNVNSYGKTLASPVSFASLLEKVCAVEGIFRVRFMTSHPKDLSSELISAFADLPKLAKHLHLPVQSGDDEILRRMNRHYTRADYLSLVERLRRACPEIALTTDFIVGFPGETEEQFLNTLSLPRMAGYDTAFAFRYSPRGGTPAARMEDQVPEEVKRERLARLNEELEAVGEPLHRAYLGKTVEVLTERVNDRGQLTGKASTNKTVNFEGSADLIGRMIPVEITQTKVHTLFGVARKD